MRISLLVCVGIDSNLEPVWRLAWSASQRLQGTMRSIEELDAFLKSHFKTIFSATTPAELDAAVLARSRGVGATVMGARWEAHEKFAERGFIDSFLGGVSPLAAKDLSPEQERNYRLAVAAYCEAQVGKPYNFNFPDPETEERFYCSQLAYRAYLTVGVNLNTGLDNRPPYLPDSIVFPEEIWQSQPHIYTR